MSSRVIEQDMGWERIQQEMKSAENAGVSVGILGDSEPSEDGADMLLIAAANEFGTADGHIPARPFIRGAFDERQRDLGKTQARLWNLVLAGKLTTDQALALLGEEHQGQIQEYMVALDTPANAPRTISQKESSNPLIDEGRLTGSVRWERT